MFCKESLGLERNGPVHELYRLKALITLEQVNTLVVEKKKKTIIIILISEKHSSPQAARLRSLLFGPVEVVLDYNHL